MIKNAWGVHPLPSEETVGWQFGTLQFWCESSGEELWLAYHYIEDGQEPDLTLNEPPQRPEWLRWILKKSQKEIRIDPIFPDLPLVVKPEYSFRVPIGVQTHIYVHVPLWAKMFVEETPIIELPTVVLSKTWFGDPLEGELCYWLSSPALKQRRPNLDVHHLAICPIKIVNRSQDELSVEKICLRVNQLSLFKWEQQLWSDEIRIRFRGKNEISEIDFTQKPPSEASKAKLITPPRNPSKKGITAKTFASIIDLSTLGFFHR